jgi:hypothetical protein
LGVRLLLLLLSLLTLTACASPAGTGADRSTSPPTSDPAASSATEQADDDLQVEFDPGDGTESRTWTLSCLGVVEGNHPDAEAACAQLRTLEDPFPSIPADAVCTEQFGGPQTARVSGRWQVEPVDLELSRIDGCHISQWNALVPLVPAVVEAEAVD